jgi:hypothetical protein
MWTKKVVNCVCKDSSLEGVNTYGRSCYMHLYIVSLYSAVSFVRLYEA